MSKSLAEVITTQLRAALPEPRAREIGAMASALDAAIGDTPLRELEDSTVMPALAALFAYHFHMAKTRKAARAARAAEEIDRLGGNLPYLSLLDETEIATILTLCDAPDPLPMPDPVQEMLDRLRAEAIMGNTTGGSIQ